MTQRTVPAALFDGIQSLDVTGPMEVFAGASRAPGVSYDLHTASLDGGPVRARNARAKCRGESWARAARASTARSASGAPGAEVVCVAERTGPLANDSGSLHLVAHQTFAEVPSPDLVIVPGGPGQDDQMENATLLGWLRAVDATTTWTTSVCTGSLLLAAAGLLKGRRATSHWLALEALKEFGAEPTGERVVFDGKYVTAAGVSSGIDMGLTLLGRIAGDDTARSVQLLTEYDPQPPYDCGSPEKAPAALVEEWRARSRHIIR